jgi:porin
MKRGESNAHILAGLHEAIATRVATLVRKVDIANKFVIAGGIGTNVGLVSNIERRLDGLKVTLPGSRMWRFRFVVALTAVCCLIGAGCVSAADAPNAADRATNAVTRTGAASDATPTITPLETPPDWLTRQTLTGDWGGSRSWLEQQSVTVKPRLTQFYQGLADGEGKHGFEYGAKADVLVTADLHKMGFWAGFSMTVHAESNFGNSVNGRGGVLIPVNAALNFPGMDGSDAFDFSSVYFGQDFGDSVSLIFGKMNMIDIVSGKAFMGGAGIDSFWNLTFVAPPTGTVPAYMIGVLTSVRTEEATYRLWVYDPNSAVNKGFNDAFANGVTIRGSIEFPVTVAGRAGHQGFTALYSTQSGTDLASLDGILVPSPNPRTVAVKNSRYYFAYSFDQYLHQDVANPEKGVGLFGQVGVSDGNPNTMRWSLLVGLGGKGMVPGRPMDNWGIGYYYDGMSKYLKDALAPAVTLRNEQGVELFYNFALTPWFVLGADLQFIKPGLASTTAVVPGLRAVIRF